MFCNLEIAGDVITMEDLKQLDFTECVIKVYNSFVCLFVGFILLGFGINSYLKHFLFRK